jgi:hypothetical protein
LRTSGLVQEEIFHTLTAENVCLYCIAVTSADFNSVTVMYVQAENNAYYANQTMLKNGYINRGANMQIYKTLIRPVVTYGCEPNIIRLIYSRRLRWAGHVARMGEREMHTGF